MRTTPTPISLTTNGPLIYEVPSRLARDWLEFRVSDADMLAEYYAQEDFPPAIFIASLNSRDEIRTMLEMCGRYYFEERVNTTLFRTSNATVLHWAQRFEAFECHKPKHRTRFMLWHNTIYGATEWRDLCVKAYLRKEKADSAKSRLELPARSLPHAAL